MPKANQAQPDNIFYGRGGKAAMERRINKMADDFQNDFKKLSAKDQQLLSEIAKLLMELSEDGKEHWQTYYG